MKLFNVIRSKLHVLYTFNSYKPGLCKHFVERNEFACTCLRETFYTVLLLCEHLEVLPLLQRDISFLYGEDYT